MLCLFPSFLLSFSLLLTDIFLLKFLFTFYNFLFLTCTTKTFDDNGLKNKNKISNSPLAGF